MTKPMTVTTTFEVSEEGLRALRHRTGQRGKATADEVRSFVHMCVNASFEDILYDYENRKQRKRTRKS